MSSDYDNAFPPLGGQAFTPDPPGAAYSPSCLAGPPTISSAQPRETPLPPLTPSEATHEIAKYDPRYFSQPPSALSLVFPSRFETAAELLARIGPNATTDDALLSTKEARNLQAMTPYAPTPTPADGTGALAVLNAMPYEPTLATPSVNGSSIHDSQLITPGMLPTPGPALTAWISRAQNDFLANDALRSEATREIVYWVASTFSNVDDKSPWALAWAHAIRTAIEAECCDEAILRKAADALGYVLVPKDAGEPTPKRSRTKVPADAGRKRTRSGSLPPLSVRAPLPPLPASPVEAEMKDGTASAPLTPPLPGLEASMHAPAHIAQAPMEVPATKITQVQMEVPDAHGVTTPPADPTLTAILSGLNGLTTTVNSFRDRMAMIKTHVEEVAAGKRPSPPPRDPTSPQGQR